ncbi:MAG: hypothetical protein M3Z04_00460 [Chloroflexota bacterium]|nr:hypothetical protein [Chloroflexota bacterium]
MIDHTSRIVRGLGVLALAGLLFAAPRTADNTLAHQSGCHTNHTCPSDTGSYVCGDLGYPCETTASITNTPAPVPAATQVATSRTFPQTGQTVSGQFLTYWDGHGALAQQGYPISPEMQETSDLNGQNYTVQYFERAVFEKHPENQPPFDTLLSQLGTFRYKQKYPGGAPGQQVSSDNARVFAETGKHLGGLFRAYWESHGGLAQQGFPISEEFTETSELNGQQYTVQYFERAVFEKHPENQPPYNVLLSQLGTFQYTAKYKGGQTPTAGPAPPTAQPAPPTATPKPAASCDLSGAKDGSATKSDIHPGDELIVRATGFVPGEPISFYFTLPTDRCSARPTRSTAA